MASALLLPISGNSADGKDTAHGKVETSKIRMTFDQHEVIVEMFDTPASRDFLLLLPLTLEFSDYAGVEKIAYLPQRLNINGTPTPPVATGDFTYYAPWGNLAVFYKGFGRDSQLLILGRIESGKEKLAAISRNFTARIEEIE